MFVNTPFKKKMNSLKLSLTGMYILNLVTFISMLMISSFQYFTGVYNRYLKPFDSEVVLLERNKEAIRIYYDLFRHSMGNGY